MNIVKLHELIDKWAAEEREQQSPGVTGEANIEMQPPRELPKDKRVVRTKTQGDKVFYLDEIKKTRQWVTTPEILASLGFEIGDVAEIDDTELSKYQMASAIYRPVNESA